MRRGRHLICHGKVVGHRLFDTRNSRSTRCLSHPLVWPLPTKTQATTKSAASVCSGRLAGLKEKTAACDKAQDAMDTAACTYTLAWGRGCMDDDTCYQAAVKNFKQVVSTTKTEEAGLFTEIEAVLRMQCLADVFADADGSRRAAIQACPLFV